MYSGDFGCVPIDIFGFHQKQFVSGQKDFTFVKFISVIFCYAKGRNLSVTALSWFASDTAQIFVHLSLHIIYRSSRPEVFLRNGVLKICSKFTGEHPYRSVIFKFIEITLWHGCSPVNLLYVFRTPFPKNISGRLLLNIDNIIYII